jgi:hypothetical protein
MYNAQVHWITAHVYVAVILLAGLLLLSGALVVQDRTSFPLSQGTVTWGGTGGLPLFGNSENPWPQRIRTADILSSSVGVEHSYIPFNMKKNDPTIIGDTSASLDLETLLAQLSSPSGGATSVDVEDRGLDIYSFVPRGLISTETAAVNRTPAQQELFEYGNRAGAYIRAFDDSHKNMIVLLKDAYEDRVNAQKQSAAKKIGLDYQELARDLLDMGQVPSSVSQMHRALANSYNDVGRLMIAKLETTTDEEFLDAMNRYNESALQFTRAYVTLITYFSIAGVQFSKNDPGSVFMFTASNF